MKHEPGIHAQSWCQGRYTHRLCNGYRFDTQRTLSGISVDVSSIEGKIEILCSCSCHDRVKMAVEDPHRFDAAFRTTSSIFSSVYSGDDYPSGGNQGGTRLESVETPSREGSGSDTFILHTLIVMSNKSIADEMLDVIEVKYRPNAQITYIVYEQGYFFLLELSMRIAFTMGGSEARDFIQDSLRSLIFMPIPIYIRARHKTHYDSEVLDKWLKDLEGPFWDRLDQAGLMYAQSDSYPEMRDELSSRLTSALNEVGVSMDYNLERLVTRSVDPRASKVMSLVDTIGERFRQK